MGATSHANFTVSVLHQNLNGPLKTPRKLVCPIWALSETAKTRMQIHVGLKWPNGCNFACEVFGLRIALKFTWASKNTSKSCVFDFV